MRFTLIILLAVSLFVGCESPQDTSSDQTLYKGRIVQEGPAPFLLNGNSLSKSSEGTLTLDEEVPDGTVYGLKGDEEVYSAEGGEVLPEKSWVDNVSSDPVEVKLTSNLRMSFEVLTEVTIVDAIDMIYIDGSGNSVVFSGTGVVTTSAIVTGPEGQVTLICAVEFSIGEEGGELG